MTDAPFNPAPQAGFQFNHPTIIALCFLASTFTGITGVVGVVLAYVWRGEPHDPWESSHYTYLIRTFWLFVLGMVAGVVLTLVLVGPLVMAAVTVLTVVRSVLSIVNAQKQMPMPNPETMVA
jgi:uncharacterized membrane protein